MSRAVQGEEVRQSGDDDREVKSNSETISELEKTGKKCMFLQS